MQKTALKPRTWSSNLRPNVELSVKTCESTHANPQTRIVLGLCQAHFHKVFIYLFTVCFQIIPVNHSKCKHCLIRKRQHPKTFTNLSRKQRHIRCVLQKFCFFCTLPIYPVRQVGRVPLFATTGN